VIVAMVLGVWQVVVVEGLLPAQLQLYAFVFEDALLLTTRLERTMERYSQV
jgi:hypothetical protein